jgi:hypothetical protein
MYVQICVDMCQLILSTKASSVLPSVLVHTLGWSLFQFDEHSQKDLLVNSHAVMDLLSV